MLVLNDGELSVQCSDPRESDYLRGLPPNVRRTWLLTDSREGSLQFPLEFDGEVSLDCRLPKGLVGLALVRGLPEWILADVQLSSSVVLAKLDPLAGVTAPKIILPNDRGPGRQVAYPRAENPGVAGVFLAGEGREYRRLPVVWEGLHAEIGVFCSSGGFAQSGSEWSEAASALEFECRFSDVPEVFVLPAFWLKPADFWMRLVDRCRNEPGVQAWLQGIVGALEALPTHIFEALVETLSNDPVLDQFRRSQPELYKLDPSPTRLASEKDDQSREVGCIPNECDRVVAFDTSSILKFGDLADHLSQTDFYVFPQVVAVEIERKKTQSQEFRRKSWSNLRTISRRPKSHWASPFSDVNHLKSGVKRNADGEIIAALIPYRQPGLKVVLVSEDLDFVPRCRAYDIDVMTAGEFMAETVAQSKGVRK